ncbi:MAG: Protein-methionine-sulfoxide reductase heme-binding subunit MsrQ [Alphaproteobacteria bacterium MarineAlpha5_Bin8]|nr:MAG: Protein-methionine-sulfoxide reductase heme-binding subunit MsrQ [Alphaproteobacteria bacterium MarineAlpha5_Bin8]PPR44969.1 MAG: Protein-methionine-sulfoxide reductase heme-binding subunit MsrQ [Alphaproteobacteria bacterium MarineAlpha5_Bin7]PPR53815.1 MAG: Protein-methionine-sulfoxide reductase heme-binding subunit MsrQ [Alphaproteobacteria bacterium MarineAlpha5_Bin6]|tara:strand:+ start:2277 stop:2912 length:636 start_codon:yes stop_codon:yes gene_type:complete
MRLSSKVVNQLKPIIFLLLILPSIYWGINFIDYWGINFIGQNLGANPIDRLMDEFGQMSLRLIILTLLVSSLSEINFFRALSNIRRMIGLFAFYYVCLHFLTYIVLDHFFNWQFILKDVIKRPFITFGFISFVLLIPLAVTSINVLVKKLGFKIWKRIHMLIYIVALLASLHYFLLTKADKTEPLIYLFIILLLLFWRLYSRRLKFFFNHH